MRDRVTTSSAALSLVPALFPAPLAGFSPISIEEANAFLVANDHNLGEVHRPFRQEAWALDVRGRIVSVAVSASIVSATVTRKRDGRVFRRGEVVELARQAAAEPWANRVMLRLWREIAAPAWECWPVLAAVSYSQNARHEGAMYRFDGWEKWADGCGSRGGGAWSRQRYATDAVVGPKSLWGWEYPS